MTICASTVRTLAYVSAVFFSYQPPFGHAQSSQTEQQQHAQAMQLGLFLGGSATQYDTCVAKGFIEPGPQKAEDKVISYLKASEQFTHDPEGIAYAHKGWDLAKQKVNEQSAKYWESNCDSIGKQWNKYAAMLKLP